MLLIIAFVSSANALEIGVGKGQIINLSRPAAHVFVANPDVADIDVRSPNYIYIYGLKTGETSLHALDANSNQIIEVNIVVTQNLSTITKVIKEVVPSSKVKFTSAGASLVMQGEVDTPEDAQKVLSIVTASLDTTNRLVNMLKVRGSDQVMLKVRVAEVSRSTMKNLGVNLQNVFNSGSLAVRLLTGRVFTDPATGLFIPNGDSLSATGRTGDFDLTGVIDALETQGLVKTLAEPNMTAKSGESATFLAGGEYPIPVPQQNGVTTIEYKEYGVSLNFTPTVLSNNKINLKVNPEVSSLTASSVTIQNNAIPTLITRRTSTTVELGSGESFAIAGLLSNDSNNNVNKFPWLGDIPILGALFKSTDFQSDESELVIIVTPYIVHGARESDKLLTPTDGMEESNDFQRFLLGKSYEEKAPGRAASGPNEGTMAKYKLNGDAGYMLEE